MNAAALLDAHFAALNARDMDAFEATMHAQVEMSTDAYSLAGRENVMATVHGLLRASPALQFQLTRVLAETDGVVVAEITITGAAATPEAFSAALHIAGLRDGRLVLLHTAHLGPSVMARATDVVRERQSLRRMAELIAHGAHYAVVFAAFSEEVARLTGAVGTALVRVGDESRFTVATWGVAGTGMNIPIVVGGRAWGEALAVAAPGEELPRDTAKQIAGFTELLGAAIATFEARTDVEHLADEQAALRRVADMIARGAEAETVLAAVVREVFDLLGVAFSGLVRLTRDGSTSLVASCGAEVDDVAAVTRWVLRTAQPARHGDAAGAPVIVEGRLWGVIFGATRAGLVPETEQRLAQFAEAVGTAISVAQARAAQQELASEQAALRHVAELVARGVAPEEVFAAVADEASQLLGDQPTALLRFESDGTATVVAQCGDDVATGHRLPVLPGTLATRVRRTAGPARIDEQGAVGAPITLEGRTWGMLSARANGRGFPPGTEHRLSQFAELVAAAIANAESRAQLSASRARVIATADEARRRIQRDVHDGAQQRLVHALLSLRMLRQALAEDDPNRPLLDEALLHTERATAELRDAVRGILPAALTQGGLLAAVESLTDDFSLPVDLAISVPRLSPAIETTAYFVIAEALTNVVKHADAEVASVSAVVTDGALRMEVRDDGLGGADPARGTGITGLFDRVAAADGTIDVDSPPGAGTHLRVVLPIPEVEVAA